MEVRKISAQETYALRLIVLRPGGQLKDTYFEGDLHLDVFHLGVYVEDEQVCIASFYPEAHAELKGKHQYRLRGMATHPGYRRKGAAKALMTSALEQLKEQEVDLIWCNAREIAVPFYEDAGFTKYGATFDIRGIGAHYVMHRSV